MTALGLGLGLPFGGRTSNPLVSLGAVFAIDARNSVAGEQTAVNFGSGGSALNARYGSTVGVDTNDPLFLPHTGTNYLYAPENGGSCSVPDASNLDITGDIDCRFRVETNSATNGRVITKGYASVYCFGFTFEGLWTEFNSGGTFYPAGQLHGMPVGSRGWFRITRVASTGVVSYYKANDSTTVPTSWTFLGSVVSTIGNLATNASVLNIAGGPGGAEAIDANLYHVQLRDGIDGTVVFEADFTKTTESSQSSFVCTTGQTVTLTRATTGRKMVLVVRPLWLFGTDDTFLHSAANTVNFGLNPYTLVIIFRSWNPETIYQTYIGTRSVGLSPAGVELSMHWDGSRRSNLTQSSTTVHDVLSTATNTAGSLVVMAGGRNASHIFASLNNSRNTGTPVGWDTSSDNVLRFYIGGRYAGTDSRVDAEIFAAAYFNKALTTGEIAQIVSYYGAA